MLTESIELTITQLEALRLQREIDAIAADPASARAADRRAGTYRVIFKPVPRSGWRVCGSGYQRAVVGPRFS
jgi:hypothetical protein